MRFIARMPVSTPNENALKIIRRALCLFATIFFILRKEGHQYRITTERLAIGYNNILAVCRQRKHFVLGAQQSSRGRRERKDAHCEQQGRNTTECEQPTPGRRDSSLPDTYRSLALDPRAKASHKEGGRTWLVSRFNR